MAAGAPVNWRNGIKYGGESKISLNSADTAAFIEFYQQEEILWNVHLPDHTHKPKRTECMKRISKRMGKNWSIEQVRDKIMSLRSRYSKEILKVRVSITSGASPCYQPVWQYFPMLDCFLRPFCVTRKTDTPVVRAFHKRLMEGGILANQPPTPAMTYPIPPRDVSATITSHFFHSPGPANTISSNQYQRDQQNAPPPLLDYLDSDDVQVIEEDVSQVMEEVAMLMDGQEDDDDDSGYNGGFQDSSFGNDGAVENGKSCSAKDEGIWVVSPMVGGDLVSGDGASGEDGGLLHESGEESSNQADHCDFLRNRESVLDAKHTGTQQVQPPLRSEEQPQNTVCVGPIDTMYAGPDQNVSGSQRSKEVSDAVVIKLERSAGLQSPPPPLLPRRLSLSEVPAEDGSIFSNSGRTSHGHQAFCLDNTVSDSGLRTKRRQSYSGEGHVRDEPFLKRIKQEKDSESFAEGSLFGEVNTPDFLTETSQQEVTSGCGLNPAYRGHTGADTISKNISEKRINQGYQSYAHRKELSSSPTLSNSHRNIPRKAANLSAHGISPPNDPTVNRTRDTASPTSNDRNSAASIVEQVTDAVSNQMTTLLQTLVTSLAEKSSGDASCDGNMPFVNYVKAELTKLDEDLQVDVKFSIQKVIYEAQKEMSRRRTHNGSNGVEILLQNSSQSQDINSR